jgi:transcriptional regulator with GAF, ATPase, and Fis domain
MTWREIVDTHHSALIDELSRRLDSDFELARKDAADHAVAIERSQAAEQVMVACEQARRSQAELLNQSLRRLRQSPVEGQILQALTETCAHYAEMSVVLVFENNQARAAATHGVEAGDLSFEIAAAPALVAAIASTDPVVAVASEKELSIPLAATLQDGDLNQGRNVYLFPLVARHTVVGMLVAAGRTLPISAPIELLCEAAGMRLETLIPAAERTRPAESQAERLSWDALSLEDQKLHLQAQRMARVRVAEMRLDHDQELRAGVASGDIYGALQAAIDKARDEFLQNFLARSSTMVDYLHLEVLRSLAHDQDSLLGKSYPGPMV